MKIIYTTTNNQKEAETIAQTIVKEKLAKCVNYFPIKSVFNWKNKIEQDSEFAVIIKTNDNTEKTMQRVKELHSYDIPCIVCLDVEKGNKEFLDWVENEK